MFSNIEANTRMYLASAIELGLTGYELIYIYMQDDLSLFIVKYIQLVHNVGNNNAIIYSEASAEDTISAPGRFVFMADRITSINIIKQKHIRIFFFIR